MRVYLTGVSGTGKSSIIRALRDRGDAAIDIDDELCHWEDKRTGERGDWQPGSSDEWHESHVWLCDIEKLKAVLAQNENVVVAGVASNQDDYLKLFDKIFVLKGSPETVVSRIESRTDNDFGKHPVEQKRILNWQGDFEKEMIEKGATALNIERPLEVVVSDILAILEK